MDGKRLKQVRRQFGDTQESFAKKLEFGTPTISKWEQGASCPNLETFKKICLMYDVSSDYLLGLSPVRSSISNPVSPEKQKLIDEFVELMNKNN